MPPPPLNVDPPNNLPLIRPNVPPPVANRNQVIVPENNGQNSAPPAIRNLAPQAQPQEFDDLADFIAYRDAENYVEPETDIIPFETYARQNNVESVTKRIIRPKFIAPILARSKCAHKLFAARNALPPLIQAQVEALCM